MTLADSGWSQCLWILLRQGGAVGWSIFYISPRNSRVLVPDQGAVSGDQGGAFVRFRVSTSSCMRERRPEGVGWYDFVCLRNNIEEGLDSEEEQWVTGSESESDTSESDIEDGQDD